MKCENEVHSDQIPAGAAALFAWKALNSYHCQHRPWRFQKNNLLPV